MEENWKKDLESLFEEIQIMERSKKEASEDFRQFCEFIAEPAFESLEEELKKYGVRTKIKKLKSRTVSFEINFPHSQRDFFCYSLFLPPNSLEFRPVLQIRSRRNRKEVLTEKKGLFMKEKGSMDLLKLKKEDLVEDIIENFRTFIFESHIPEE